MFNGNYNYENKLNIIDDYERYMNNYEEDCQEISNNYDSSHTKQQLGKCVDFLQQDDDSYNSEKEEIYQLMIKFRTELYESNQIGSSWFWVSYVPLFHGGLNRMTRNREEFKQAEERRTRAEEFKQARLRERVIELNRAKDQKGVLPIPVPTTVKHFNAVKSNAQASFGFE